MKTKTNLLSALWTISLLSWSVCPGETLYQLTVQAIGAGGRQSAAGNYSNLGSLGGIGGSTASENGSTVARPGFPGQLFEVVGIFLPDEALVLDEWASCRLSPAANLDDGSTLEVNPADADWTVLSGPVGSIPPDGLLVADNVYMDQPASVRMNYIDQSVELALLIRNVGDDDFGSYAGDQLPDDWQVDYFGVDNPDAGPGKDPDSDGQNNQFEQAAGLDPNNPESRFHLHIENVPGQSTQKRIIFSPRFASREYTVEFQEDFLISSFAPLPASSVADAGLQRTVTDLQATSPARFYRVRITPP